MMERDPEASGTIEIRDGGESGTLIHKFDINNGTFPVSLTTQSNKMGIIFNNNVPHRPSGDPTKRCKHLRGCIRFLFELTTNYGKSEVNVLLGGLSQSNQMGSWTSIHFVLKPLHFTEKLNHKEILIVS